MVRQIQTIGIHAIAMGLAMASGRIALAQSSIEGHSRRSKPAAVSLGLQVQGAYFVPNQGQWQDRGVLYALRSRGLDLAFRKSSLTMHLMHESRSSENDLRPLMLERCGAEIRALPSPTRATDSDASRPLFEQMALAVTFPGSNDVMPSGVEPQAAKFNYMLGGEGRRATDNVPSFAAVTYTDLYDGVDLLVRGNDDGVIKYEFHVAPGADWTQIRIAYDGVDSLNIEPNGDLCIKSTFGQLRDGAPAVWQESADARHPVPAHFELCDSHTYRIVLEQDVDSEQSLIIDPDVEWMTYLGGGREDIDSDIATDSNGNIWVCGRTTSAAFEGRINQPHDHEPDIGDAFVVQMNSSGELQWMTYLGGSYIDEASALAIVDGTEAMVSGMTRSEDFEGRNNTNHGGPDGFVARLSDAGQLQWMTYLGGNSSDSCDDILVTTDGRMFVMGNTYSDDLPMRNNTIHDAGDVYVMQLGQQGEVLSSIYLGGSGNDWPGAMVMDAESNLAVAGYTYSDDFEGRLNDYRDDYSADAFVAKLNENGELSWMTYLGGSDHDSATGIVPIDGTDLLLVGSTRSSNFVGRNNEFRGSADAFVLRLAPDGTLRWMYYLGGTNNDYGAGIGINARGEVYVSGMAASSTFDGAVNASHGGVADAFLLRMDGIGRVAWMMYLGGAGFDYAGHLSINGIRGARIFGSTYSTDFEGRTNEYHGGSYDVFVASVSDVVQSELRVNASCPGGGPIEVTWDNATPNGQVALLFASNTGSFVIPRGRPCKGTTLGLDASHIRIAFEGGAGPDGSRTLNSMIGAGVCGGYLQLVDLSTCEPSNVVRIE